jgi:hypothetical protein
LPLVDASSRSSDDSAAENDGVQQIGDGQERRRPEGLHEGLSQQQELNRSEVTLDCSMKPRGF